jgi:hypothetical protein
MVVSVEIEQSVTHGLTILLAVSIDRVNVKLVVTAEASEYLTSIENAENSL